MAEIRTRVCDFGRDSPGGRLDTLPCRRLSDSHCEMCSGDYCNDHLKPQGLALTAQFIKRSPADNNTPKVDTASLEITEIKLCPTCHALLARSYEARGTGVNRGAGGNAAHIETINTAIREARATIVESIKAFWALKALEKGTP